jgi:hypothetical protein
MYGSDQKWKYNPNVAECPAGGNPCCQAVPNEPWAYVPVFVAGSNSNNNGTVRDLESAAWYWTAPDAVFTNSNCSQWDRIMQQNGNSSVFSWTLKNAWKGKGYRCQFESNQNCTLMVQSLTRGPVTCNGDLDNSLHTDIDDLLLVVEGWGTVHGDITGDGLTNIDDLLVVLKDWGCDHR